MLNFHHVEGFPRSHHRLLLLKLPIFLAFLDLDLLGGEFLDLDLLGGEFLDLDLLGGDATLDVLALFSLG